MFDAIDTDGSGEITKAEFRRAFISICRDEELVLISLFFFFCRSLFFGFKQKKRIAAKKKVNAYFVDLRMEELDYNHDQEITFREFIYGISGWVGFADELSEQDDDDVNLDKTPTDSQQEGAVKKQRSLNAVEANKA
ncbi:hypothetical protein RFI_13723 [Reticulomyxa filosa]|uniref:EF-hand domain-containing protein n=1 Tax=Reticulomyxa filosa TaxID=46433 RepID=X6NB00_RETFI|nr:hypothetical protein RFI_13723 [Reticulomyxa filosa]|eukprot:ETO23455.1 hypothetical protein RFI_13723 [Reticulomyxa filosa]